MDRRVSAGWWKLARARAGSTITGVLFAALAAILALPAQTAPSLAAELEFHDPFRPCAADCAVTVLSGGLVETAMMDIFVNQGIPPWKWKYGRSAFIGAAVSRELVTWGNYGSIEGEIGVGKRFGIMDEGEGWVALYFRWKWFPWNEYVRTTIATSTGVNVATDIADWERKRTVNSGRGSYHQHYFSPEITFGLPQYPNTDLVFRFHHRSGASLGIFNHTYGAAQYATVGVRHRF
jgi:hypothetical protein